MRPLLAAAAALAASICAACGGSGQARSSGSERESAVPARVQRNQIVLSAKESQALLTWASRFRSCLADRGRATDVRVTRRDISLVPKKQASMHELLKLGTACGEALGGPPPRASLQVLHGKFVLYLPKQCLLDGKVARRRT